MNLKRVIKTINNNDKILCLVDNFILKKNKIKIENFIKKKQTSGYADLSQQYV